MHLEFGVMVPEDRFEIVDRQREPKPHIVLRRHDGGELVTLDAASLVAQYALSEVDTLLILDEDTPFEEQLHIALLQGDQILDHIIIGAPYATGAFRTDGGDDDTLRFCFEGDAVWTLSIRPEGWRGLGGLPSGARRRGGLLARRYIVLDHGDGE